MRDGSLVQTLDTYFLPHNRIFNQSVLEFSFPDEIKLPAEDYSNLTATDEEKATNKTLIECDALQGMDWQDLTCYRVVEFIREYSFVIIPDPDFEQPPETDLPRSHPYWIPKLEVPLIYYSTYE